MLNMFKPKKSDQIYYDLFSLVLTDTCTAAERLENLFKDISRIDEILQELEDYEHKCDRTVHDLIDHLNHTFITPFDREDIFYIIKIIDDIMDNIESTAFGLKLMNIDKIRPESLEMTKLIVECTRVLKIVVDELKNMKNSKILRSKIIEVNRIENQGDDVYRKVMRELFTEETAPLEIIKWKEIYENMEVTLDACENVANIIEGIVSKNV